MAVSMAQWVTLWSERVRDEVGGAGRQRLAHTDRRTGSSKVGDSPGTLRGSS